MKPVKQSDLAIHSSWSIVITSHNRAKQPKNKKKKKAGISFSCSSEKRFAYPMLAEECSLALLSLSHT